MKLAAYKPKQITLTVEIDEDLAWQFAQFLKRVHQSDYRNLATSDQEALDMMLAGFDIQSALADAGVNPR